jgi:hypothetical protein
MLTLADVEATLKQLAHERPVFHSEADFQHALAWSLRERIPNLPVRLEYPLPWEGDRSYADIWLRAPGGDVVLELKYWKRNLRITLDGEEFNLPFQGAQDLARYDFLKDLSRVERLVAVGKARTGAVIAITNDHLYWQGGRPNTVDADFRIHEGRRLSGTMSWSDAASDGTKRSREADLTLRGVYHPVWQPYFTVDGEPYGEFRYLFLPVDKAPDRR